MIRIFTIYDSKAQAYLQPFFCVNNAVAIRTFTTAANNPEHDFNRYAADYTLFAIGEFEPTSGNINIFESKVNLGMASEFLDAGAR